MKKSVTVRTRDSTSGDNQKNNISRWNAGSGYAPRTPKSEACAELSVDAEKSFRRSYQDRTYQTRVASDRVPSNHLVH